MDRSGKWLSLCTVGLTHCWLDDVGLHSVVCPGLGVGGVGLSRSSGIMTRHDFCLTTYGRQNTPVTEDEDHEDFAVEACKEDDPVDHLKDPILPDGEAVADAIYNGACLERHGHVEDDADDPWRCHQTVRRPLAQVLPAPDRVNDLQIAVDGDDGKVEHGALKCAPEKVLADDHHADPVAERTGEIEVGYLQCVGHDEQERAGKIEYVLVDDQCVPLVLFRGHHGVQDERVGCRSDNADDYDGAAEIKIGAARRR